MNIRTRVAPSPSGYIHIGNYRTFLMNFVFKERFQGKMYLRIEDTDKTRSTMENEIFLLKTLQDMGINYDKYFIDYKNLENDLELLWESNEKNLNLEKYFCENNDFNKTQNLGYVRQSEQSEFYEKIALKLKERGYAYYCKCENSKFCECLEEKYKEGVLRFKTPHNKIVQFQDMIYGTSQINSNEIENFALLRSDKSPTYHLCVVIDDVLMNISHIIRGVEHFRNSYKQILLRQALENIGFKINEVNFGHLPLIVDNTGKKLSKRHGASNVEELLKEGFVPDAINSYLLKLGWGYKGEEIVSMERAKEIFDIKDVGRAPVKFDLMKLKSYSYYFLKNFNYDAYGYFIKYAKNKIDEFYKEKNFLNLKESFSIIYDELITRSTNLKEISDLYIKLFFRKDFKSIDLLENKEQKDYFTNLSKVNWNKEKLDNFLRIGNFAENCIKLRYLLVNSQSTPPMLTYLLALGKQETLRRLGLF